MIQATPTWYAGHKFRSRLEARWAVFFDTLELKWEYEPQGYVVGPAQDRRAYLPDFWLPTEELWVEVKGQPTVTDAQTAYYAAHPDSGLPGRSQGPRLAMLGNIPQVEFGWMCNQHLLTYCAVAHKYTPIGLYTSSFVFLGYPTARIKLVEDFGIQILPEYVEQLMPSVWHFDAFVTCEDDPWGGLGYHVDARTAKAYIAARSARFEHGQSGGSS